jgi:SAM-dependent methyltransferase
LLPLKFRFILKSIFYNLKNLLPIHQKSCPICNYDGYFYPFGRPPRSDAQCPSCHSLERHRLFYLLLISQEMPFLENNSKILHFAPEQFLIKFFRKYQNYITADIAGNVDKLMNIEKIDFPNNTFDLIVVNHVFEHVDDLQAFKEIYDVLKPGGLLIASVPIIYGWTATYENELIKTDKDKLIHFGQHDHVRYYGADFTDRITKNCDLKFMKTFSLSKLDEIKYGLMRGEKIYFFKKNAN